MIDVSTSVILSIIGNDEDKLFRLAKKLVGLNKAKKNEAKVTIGAKRKRQAKAFVGFELEGKFEITRLQHLFSLIQDGKYCTCVVGLFLDLHMYFLW